jgi:predicted glycosyltransferase
VLEFISNPDLLLSRADRIVSMGGYNTTCEVLSYEKHALIVPRSKPRHEQQIRAERLHALGLLEVLPPDQVSPQALSEWLCRDLGPPPRVRERIDLNGCARLPALLREVLTASRSSNWSSPLQREIEHAEL